jgi:2-polyprenyl-3-methyl-5-hydroxy-6-metoxy-1,4-benzoquinol methylase
VTKLTHCPICSGRSLLPTLTTKDHDTLEAFEFVRCDQCTHEFISNQPEASQLSNYYNHSQGVAMARAQTSFVDRLSFVQFGFQMNQMLRDLPKGASILDFGCGNGLLVKWLVQKGFDALGTDFHSGGLAHIPESRLAILNLNDPNAIRSYLGQLAKPPELVIVRHVLEHLIDPKSILATFQSAGIKQVLVWVPNGHSIWKRIWGQYWAYWDPPRHLQVFNAASLGAMATLLHPKRIDFKLESIDEISFSFYRFLRIVGNGRFRNSKWVTLFGAKSMISIACQVFTAPVSKGVVRARIWFA